MDAAVYGFGKLGAPMAALFASAGMRVRVWDSDPAVMERLSQGECSVREPGLAELLARHAGRIHAAKSAADAVVSGGFHFIIVPTPSGNDGRFSNQHIFETLTEIALELSDEETVVVTGTVMPGSTGGEIKACLTGQPGMGPPPALCYNPEFIALGSVLDNMRRPDFLLIGADEPADGARLAGFYARLYRGLGLPMPRVAHVPFIDAEIAKLALNCAVTMKISYANMLARLCEQVPGADAAAICRAVGMDTRIGPKFLSPGTAFGGPCFPRDGRAFRAFVEPFIRNAYLSEATDAENRDAIVNLAARVLARKPQRVAILGLTYKVGTPVTEESAGLKLAARLAPVVKAVDVYDPELLRDGIQVEPATLGLPANVFACPMMDACCPPVDVIVVTLPDPSYRKLSPVWLQRDNGRPLVIDCWRVLEPIADEIRKYADYEVVGRG